VSPGHRILLNGLSISAWELVNGTTITQEWDGESVTYFHFELTEHSGVLANGVLAESFFGGEASANRASFEERIRVLPNIPYFGSVTLKKPVLLGLVPQRA
jgi:hypothetical protein